MFGKARQNIPDFSCVLDECCRKLEEVLVEERSSARAAAEEAACKLSAVEHAAGVAKQDMQEQVALLEQRLSEASAVQEDLATRLQVCLT